MFNQVEKRISDKNRIEIKNISKSFKINCFGRDMALSHVTNLFGKKKQKKTIQVLNDISFNVKDGEVLGIIGRNGSGKSTLLRVLAEIYFPDFGHVTHYGDVFYLTTMGVGLSDKLTMKENIFLVGAIMGLSQKRIKEIFDEIVQFSELEDFVNLKIRQFSTGMIGRLGFSISIFCMKNKRSEILLLDEVFGSGADFEFENKAIIKMEELIKGGATVVMVSHDLELMEKYCDRIIWLDQGKIKEVGNPKIIIDNYKKY